MLDLDIFCAAKVMGWKMSQKNEAVRHGMFGVGSAGAYIVHPELGGRLIWKPTSSRDQAMQVLEMCCEKTEIEVSKPFKDWQVIGEVDDKLGHDKFLRSHAETLPLAICLFSKELFT